MCFLDFRSTIFMEWCWKFGLSCEIRDRKGEIHGRLQHYSNNHFMALCLGLLGWAGTRRNIHPLTPFLIINRPLSASSIHCDPWHPPCSISMLDSLFHNLSPSSLCSISWSGTLHSIHFFIQSLYSLFNACPYHHNLFCCSTEIMSSIPTS